MSKGTFRNYVCTKGARGGQLGAILCKLLRLEVYIKRGGEGVPKIVKHLFSLIAFQVKRNMIVPRQHMPFRLT